MSDFFSGMITMGFLIAALFFLRFWWRTHDALFATFSVAFFLFALNQGLVTWIESTRDEKSWIYLLRLAGFGLIIYGIAVKNAVRKRGH